LRDVICPPNRPALNSAEAIRVGHAMRNRRPVFLAMPTTMVTRERPKRRLLEVGRPVE
jgi:hypothetical protein